MLRFFLPIFLLVLPGLVQAQDVDSLAASQQIDSLIQVSRDLTGKRDFEQALAVNAEAERVALEGFGRESAEYGSVCFNRGRVMGNKNDFPEAEKWYLESKEIRERAIGKDNADYAWSLNNLADLYRTMGAYDKAEPLHLEALAIREKVLGKEHPDYASSLNNLAILYIYMGNYKKAESLFLESLDILEKIIDKEHPYYVSLLNNLAELYRRTGVYDKVESMLLNVLNIREKVLGKEHPDYALSLNNLGVFYREVGKYKQAGPLLIEALAIRERVHGKRHEEYAKSLHNLADHYVNIGYYNKSEALYIEVLKIIEEIAGKEHSNYAGSLNNLANLYKVMGRYSEAEQLHHEVIENRKRVFGKEHPEYAIALNNLAVWHEAMGNYEKAEPLHLEALAIREKVLGNEHPDYASTLNNLAGLYMYVGHYSKAEGLYLETEAICEKVLGKEHPLYASSLSGLGSLYYKMDKYDKAEQLYLKAKAIREKVLGKDHFKFSESLYNLANVYSFLGNNDKAELLHLETITIQEKVLGKEHPDYATSLSALAQLYWRSSTPTQSLPLYQELSTRTQSLVTKASHHLSERELNNYLQTFSQRQNEILSFTQQPDFQASELTQTCYDNSLFFKGFLLHNAGKLQHIALTDSLTTEAYYQLKAYKRRLTAEYAKPIAERKNVEELEEKANAIEKELTRSVAGFEAATRQVTWQEVQSALQPDAAAIEFVHYRYMTPKETDSTMYAALVLLPGAAAPAFIPLCEERELIGLLDSSGTSNFYAGLYRGETKFVPLHTDKAQGKALYDLIWQPLEELLQGTKTIHYAPSGLLHRLNLAAIKTPSDSLLGERHHLITLGSTRQLVPEATIRPDTLGREFVLFGGVNFEADSTLAPPPIDSTDMPAGMFVSRSAAIDSAQRQSTWPYLEGAAREVQNIHDTLARKGLPVRLHKGHEATEEALKQLGEAGQLSPRVLHLATHGFFSPDPKAISRSMDGEPVFKWSDNPMMRSGLVLAGGNHAWQHGRPLYPGLEDGILTAQDITQMNLRNTELVVLSACETGLGDIQGNEGVYGLQRAFKIAGAQYLIMSLWKVPDEETAEFMEAFYGHWLEGDGMPIPDAFRMTQEEMRGKYKEPYRWAGFVLVE